MCEEVDKMSISGKWGILIIIVLLLALPLLAACGDDEETNGTAEPTTEPTAKDVTIKIGLLTDKTGPAAEALIAVDKALDDVVKYFNDNDLIEGAKLEIVYYDTQYDPAKDATGYENLKGKGVDLMCAGVPSSPIVNKPSADKDKMIIFSLTAAQPMYDPPGYVFCINIPADASVYTIMNWLEKNDPNFPTDRPAKVGAVGVKDPYAELLQGGLKAYCDAHSEAYEWVEGFLVDYTTINFASQVDALKNCDYIMPPSTGSDIPGFMKQYRQAGGKGRFLGTDAQMAYLDSLVQGAGYEVMDGMVFALPYTWWTEEGEIVELAKQALSEYHSEAEATGLKNSGGAYRGGFTQWYGTISIIADTIKAVGAENFDSEALYNHCVGYSATLDGNKWSYSDDPAASAAKQRTSWAGLGIFEMSAESEDLTRISDGWTPVLMTP